MPGRRNNVIKPIYNVPCQVVLDQGAERCVARKNSRGDYYDYTVNHGDAVLFLSPQGRAALLQTGAQAGDVVELVKTKHKGQETYKARILSDASEPPAGDDDYHVRGGPHQSKPAVARQASRPSGFPPRCFAQPLPGTMPRDGILPQRHGISRAVEHAQAARNGNGNGNGHYETPAPAPPEERPDGPGPTERQMRASLRIAVDVVADAQEYARERGIGLSFLGNDIRAIALSIFINHNQNGGRR